MATTTVRPATEKQLAFLARLIAQKPAAAETHGLDFDAIVASHPTTNGASRAIDLLMAAPREYAKDPTAYQPAVKNEVHYVDGTVYRCVLGRQSGNWYVNALDVTGGTGWQYQGQRPFAFLTAATKLTYEQAVEFGLNTGWCAVCGTVLERPETIALGIGPKCAERVYGIKVKYNKKAPKPLADLAQTTLDITEGAAA